jgi:hypothetical protein
VLFPLLLWRDIHYSHTQLLTDNFMKQVSHAQNIVSMLKDHSDEDATNVRERLEAILSHSDGIRGFFVTYLTTESRSSPAEPVPPLLIHVLDTVDSAELVPLACMNVVMPTGMITMHTDANLSESSKRTAERGTQVLKALLRGSKGEAVRKQCVAIRAVARAKQGDADDASFAYWVKFFDKWGYKELQKKDIAQAMDSLL